MRAALAACVLSLASPASSHCYSIWNYPTPQHCGVKLKPIDRSWSVEITQMPSEPKDERSTQDIEDQAEHDAAVEMHHDEINTLMYILQTEKGNPGEQK